MTMSYNDLDDAITVSRRFIYHAKKAQYRLVTDQTDKAWACISGTRETAQARRTSMDLSRVLSDLRSS